MRFFDGLSLELFECLFQEALLVKPVPLAKESDCLLHQQLILLSYFLDLTEVEPSRKCLFNRNQHLLLDQLLDIPMAFILILLCFIRHSGSTPGTVDGERGFQVLNSLSDTPVEVAVRARIAAWDPIRTWVVAQNSVGA